MKALFIHAHFDDFEFTAAGTFELWRRRLGADFRGRVIICTDGRAGHHFRTREETGAMRLREQEASAAIGGYEFRPLRLRDGSVPREACLSASVEVLAALWKEIREFEPDYLFCPPVPADPLEGMHIDHVAVADAVRKVAYLVNVPHAFTPEYPADETRPVQCRVPVILACCDAYMKGANSPDLAIDLDRVFPAVSAMAYCHRSQIAEWLPWVASPAVLPVPSSAEEWQGILRQRFRARAAAFGIEDERPLDLFMVTAWGTVPTLAQLQRDFPDLVSDPERLGRLARRLQEWGKG